MENLCISQQSATHVCVQEDCHAYALLCNQQSCECRQLHQGHVSLEMHRYLHQLMKKSWQHQPHNGEFSRRQRIPIQYDIQIQHLMKEVFGLIDSFKKQCHEWMKVLNHVSQKRVIARKIKGLLNQEYLAMPSEERIQILTASNLAYSINKIQDCRMRDGMTLQLRRLADTLKPLMSRTVYRMKYETSRILHSDGAYHCGEFQVGSLNRMAASRRSRVTFRSTSEYVEETEKLQEQVKKLSGKLDHIKQMEFEINKTLPKPLVDFAKQCHEVKALKLDINNFEFRRRSSYNQGGSRSRRETASRVPQANLPPESLHSSLIQLVGCFRNLKTLHLDLENNPLINSSSIVPILSEAPHLEDVSLDLSLDSKGFRKVYMLLPSLKRFTVGRFAPHQYDIEKLFRSAKKLQFLNIKSPFGGGRRILMEISPYLWMNMQIVGIEIQGSFLRRRRFDRRERREPDYQYRRRPEREEERGQRE